MVEPDPEAGVPDEVERIAESPDSIREAWNETIADTRAMAADREEAGYETMVLVSQDTSPVAPDAGDGDEWGLTHLVDGDTAEEFTEARERLDFDETAVYQAAAADSVFLVTECLDHDAEFVLLIAGAFRRREAVDLVRAALDREKMYSHVRLLDGTIVGSIEHDDASAFFPNPGEYLIQGGERTSPDDAS
ncbi:DUF7529 family protein [Halolamina salifodinae]|uniref:Uncharacterized protein n=1 Tax=Halolamina salifodinae TaxID=1202767 RepID=A0A8T4GUI7_9EURY|nr:hypothetical protein [Halolamina salifodinae]MBP1986060.1 hypothetical protein [Halolamina salifodinae]